MRATHNRHAHRNIQAHLCLRYFLHIFLCCSIVCAISLTKDWKHHGRNFSLKYILKKTSFEAKNWLVVLPSLVYQAVAIDKALIYSPGMKVHIRFRDQSKVRIISAENSLRYFLETSVIEETFRWQTYERNVFDKHKTPFIFSKDASK